MLAAAGPTGFTPTSLRIRQDRYDFRRNGGPLQNASVVEAARGAVERAGAWWVARAGKADFLPALAARDQRLRGFVGKSGRRDGPPTWSEAGAMRALHGQWTRLWERLEPAVTDAVDGVVALLLR